MIFQGGSCFNKKRLEKLLKLFFALTIGNTFLKDFKKAQISKTKLEKLLKCMTLTIGK